jgi:hypothetical protein
MVRTLIQLYSFLPTDAQIFIVDRDEYVAPIPEAERHDMVLAYHAQLNSVDDQTRITAAKAWSKWESVSFVYCY